MKMSVEIASEGSFSCDHTWKLLMHMAFLLELHLRNHFDMKIPAESKILIDFAVIINVRDPGQLATKGLGAM